ncbi:MAG: hypothetical protein K5905_20635 [Roseibium sp.]|uniref:hypothetical protein n=1 Tax=Roseibium sp. TaxID=1936156 RepID=UPI00261C9CCC|nr:hypothetical protein [Roseibium sp.]MCV0427871.1 hypothetical protein [Roseibium sp.]
MANVVTLTGEQGDILFVGAGKANVVTHTANYGDINFIGAGEANVLTLTGEQGNIDFVGAGKANVVTHIANNGNIDFIGAGNANVLTLTGEQGDIDFIGAGKANVVTHTANNGNIDFIGAGNANVLTLTGEQGNIDFIGAGKRNILTIDTTEAGKLAFFGGGSENVINALGGNTDIHMRGVGKANVINNFSASGDTDVILASKGNLVTHTSDGRLTARVAGKANIVTNTGSGHSNIVAVGKGNVVTLSDGGSEVVVAGAGNIVTAGSGFDKVLAFGEKNLVLTGGAGAGELDEVTAIGKLSIVDAGAGARFLSPFAHNPLDALNDLSGLTESVLNDDPVEDTPTVALGSGPGIDFAQARAQQATSGTGSEVGLEGVSEEELAQAEAQASTAQYEDSFALIENAKTAAVEDIKESEATEKAATESENDFLSFERDLSSSIAAQANTQDADDVEDAGDVKGDGVQTFWEGEQKNPADAAFVWSGLGLGGQWKHENGVGQIVVGTLNVTFGSDGNDVIIALGRMNVVFGGAGNDVIIAGSPSTGVRTIQKVFGKEGGMLGKLMDSINKVEAFLPNKLLEKAGKDPHEQDRKTASRLTGAIAIGGAGDDIIVLLSQFNLAVTGTGTDTVVALGKGNLIIKEMHGALRLGLGGTANIVVHTGKGGVNHIGEDGKVTSHSRLTGLMMGQANIAYAHDGVDVHGLVMMGKGNLVVKTGQGNVYAGMLGFRNALYAIGKGHDVVVQAGISHHGFVHSLVGFDVPLKLYASSVFLRDGDGNSAFGQFGSINIAVKVGNGHVTGASAGGQSLLFNDGDGNLFYAGVTLKETHSSWVVKLGHGDMSSFLVSAARPTTGGRQHAGNFLNSALKTAGHKQLGEGKTSILGKITSFLTSQNMALQVGDGTFTGVAVGATNVMIRVGAGQDTPNTTTSADVQKDLEKLKAAGELGAALPNALNTKSLRIGDFDTQMLAVSIGGWNVMLDVNSHSHDKMPLDFAKDRQRAIDLLKHVRTEGAPNRARLTLNEFMSQTAQGSRVATSDTLMAAITMPGWGRKKDDTPSQPQTPVDPGKPRGRYVEFSGSTYDYEHLGKNPFELKGKASEASVADSGTPSGRNILAKLGNGDFVGVAISPTTFFQTLMDLKEVATNGKTASNHEKGEIEKFLHYGHGRYANSLIDRKTSDYMYENYGDEWNAAFENDQEKIAASTLVDNTPIERDYFSNGETHRIYDKARNEVKAELTKEAKKHIKELKKTSYKDKAEAAGNELLNGGGNVLIHAGHGNARMAAAGNKNLIIKAGLGNDYMVALGNKNIMIQMADPITTQSLVEVGQDVQIAVGTGNIIANVTGTSNDYIVVVNPNVGPLIYSLATDLPYALGLKKRTRSGPDRSGYVAPEIESGNLIKKEIKSLTSKIAFYTSSKTRSEAFKKQKGKFLTDFKKSFTLEALNKSAKKLPFVNQAFAVKDGFSYLVNNISTANFVLGGRGSDKIVAVGEFNIVFGDNIVDVLEFDVRSLVSAKMQLYKFLPFGLDHLLPVDFRIKTINGNVGELFGGVVPNADGLPSIDPDGAAKTVRDAWANNLETSLLTAIKLPPIGGTIVGTITEAVSAVGAGISTLWGSDFKEVFTDLEFGNAEGYLNEDVESKGAQFSSAVSRFQLFSVVDFDDLFTKGLKDNGFQGGIFEHMQKFNYLHGDGDLIVMAGENNVAFAGHGNDIAVTLASMNLLTMGDGNDLAVALGNDNRVNGDAGADLLIALGSANLVTGDDGNDIVAAAGSLNRVHGEDGDDILIGLGTKNLFFGGDGVDLIIGAGIRNFFYAGEGQDIIFGLGFYNYYNTGGGDDIIFNAGFGSVLETATGADFIKLGGKGNAVYGGADDDTYTTDQDASHVMASAGTGNDTLHLGGSENLFLGDEGNDAFVVTDKMLTGNIVGDARVGEVYEYFQDNTPEIETDVIKISANVTDKNPNKLETLLNDVWFSEDGDDLKIETRATKDVTGLRLAGDVTFEDYFKKNDNGAFSGPSVEILNDDNSVTATLTADMVKRIATHLKNPTDGDGVANGFFDLSDPDHGLSEQLQDMVASIDFASLTVEHQVEQNNKFIGITSITASATANDIAVIEDKTEGIVLLHEFEARPDSLTGDVIQVSGAAIGGGDSDAHTIGELLNDLEFGRVEDNLILRSRAAHDTDGKRVEGRVAVTDYFKDIGNGIAGADIQVLNDNGSLAARFTASRVHDLINTIASLEPDEMGANDDINKGFFFDPQKNTFAARPITDFV